MLHNVEEENTVIMKERGDLTKLEETFCNLNEAQISVAMRL
jgi:hypothetical protein